MRPYSVFISSRDYRREKYLGSFMNIGNAFRKCRSWRDLGRQSNGCLFYIRNRHHNSEHVVA